ncbi:hypothetical protein B4U79_16363 [Dinothrombium tinctorium]|uniref:SKP1 component dimerisation domain-containing protein n=1 Tax=Dinothrombium tinctorium TaxID=1965070 RepID=A0A3S3RUN5_9ACAR|nr:hypothetical protein B4U79_16718 [Dinothrombium tinctorium]RWS01554.1 hypothetical protein B4U79_16717 [Dinothrombium tinctorium]RWS02896.1 hypothetical protein B4U79_16571 [Dinothrombium tinctorium]RWS04973.1 hypothetical protein B4U79_16363 [Dinothrombium tinctorium]
MVQWMRHHKDDTDIYTESEENEAKEGTDECDENRTQNASNEIDPWDVEFLDVDLSTILDLINGAAFLKVKGLFDICCMKIYTLNKGKSSEEIRSMLRERCNFKEDKLQQISKKYEWLARND